MIEYLGNRLAIVDVVVDGAFTEPQFINPLRKRLSFSVVGNHARGASIQGLLPGRSPAAILRRVVAVIINSIQACTCGWIAHVRAKVQKGTPPPLADFYTSTAVARITYVVCVVAPANHASPGVVDRAEAKTVRCDPLFQKLARITAATCAVATTERRAIDDLFVAAGAAASPHRGLYAASERLFARIGDDRPSAKLFSYHGFHKDCFNMFIATGATL